MKLIKDLQNLDARLVLTARELGFGLLYQDRSRLLKSFNFDV